MPYIEPGRRKELVFGFPHSYPKNCGELNYVLIKMCLNYLCDERGYADYNEVMGVLECVKQEFYRRVITPYENKKRKENGDVFK